MGDAKFDRLGYWKERHVRFRGDRRSVGHIAWSDAKNEKLTQAGAARLNSLVPGLFDSTASLEALDLGCGVGRFAPLITGLGFAYTGVDVSPDALDQAMRKCPSGIFVQADICAYRPQRRFDLILTLYVLIHVVDDGRWSGALDVIARSMSPRGVCILIDEVPVTRYQPADHVVFRSADEYGRAVTAGTGVSRNGIRQHPPHCFGGCGRQVTGQGREGSWQSFLSASRSIRVSKGNIADPGPGSPEYRNTEVSNCSRFRR